MIETCYNHTTSTDNTESTTESWNTAIDTGTTESWNSMITTESWNSTTSYNSSNSVDTFCNYTTEIRNLTRQSTFNLSLGDGYLGSDSLGGISTYLYCKNTQLTMDNPPELNTSFTVSFAIRPDSMVGVNFLLGWLENDTSWLNIKLESTSTTAPYHLFIGVCLVII